MLKTPLPALALCLLLAAPIFARGSFVYVSNYGDGTISQFRANPNGTLTPLSPPTVKAHVLCHSLTVARGQFLYATSARDWHRRDCVISQFRILNDGRLIALSPAQVPAPASPTSIVVEPYGRFAYVFNRGGGAAQFKVAADGQLLPLSPAYVNVANAGGVTPITGFDKSHHILYGSYVVGFGDVTIGGRFALRIGSEGQLKPLSHGRVFSTSQQTVSPPNSLSLTPNGRYAYVTESLHDMRVASQWRDVVAQYQTCNDGSLKPLSPAAVPVELAGVGFVDPEGHFLYVTGSRLARARLHRNGTLGRFTSQTLPSQIVPNASEFAFAPSGRFCYAVDGDYVYLFRCRTDGSLSPLRPERIVPGYGPLGIVCVRW